MRNKRYRARGGFEFRSDMKSTQYGHSFMILNDDVRGRCTITSADSGSHPDAKIGVMLYGAHLHSEGGKRKVGGWRDAINAAYHLSGKA